MLTTSIVVKCSNIDLFIVNDNEEAEKKEISSEKPCNDVTQNTVIMI